MRYSSGSPAAGQELPRSLHPLASFGVQATYSRESPPRTNPPLLTIKAPDSNLTHRIAIQLMFDDAKFSGNSQVSLDDDVAEYDLVSHEFGLPHEQKLRYFHDLLREDAKSYYLSELQVCAMSYMLLTDPGKCIRRGRWSSSNLTRSKNMPPQLHIFHEGGAPGSSSYVAGFSCVELWYKECRLAVPDAYLK